MALYHLSVKPVSRGAGRSAVAAAAYRTAEALRDARTGQAHDYTRKRGVEARLLLVPQRGGVAAFEGAGWTAERERLWNAAEAAERRKDARVAREYEVALPCELDADGRHRLVAAFAGELARRHGVAVDAAIHAPGREGDQRNWHAHVLATTRRVTGDEIGGKAEVELSDAARAKLGLGKAADEIEGLRAVWGGLANRALAQARAEARVDHRSFARQGIEREAEQHLGAAASGLERRAARRERARGAEASRMGTGLEAGLGPIQARERPPAAQAPPTAGPAPEGPARPSAGVFGAGATPATRIGQRNAEARGRNQAREAAQRALEVAQRVLRDLERTVRHTLDLARGLGAQAAREREEAQQRAEQDRMTAELRRQEERAPLRRSDPAKAADDHWRQRAGRQKREQPNQREEPDLEM